MAAAIFNNTMFVVVVGRATDRRNRGDDGLVQQRISRLIALVVLGTEYLSATPL